MTPVMEMRQLTRRQWIFLAVAAAAALYAMAEFFFLGGPGKQAETAQKAPAADVKALMGGIASSAGPYRPSGLDAYVIRRAEAGWPRDPFVDGKVYRRWFAAEAAAGAAEKTPFTYTGYLEVNRKRMAIINGMEYKEGDPLETEGYVVRSISPAKVVVYRAGDRTTLEVPIQE